MTTKLYQQSRNATVYSTPEATVLVSYETPVACYIPGEGVLVTDEHYSMTTNKHIRQFVQGRPTEVRPQAFFDALMN